MKALTSGQKLSIEKLIAEVEKSSGKQHTDNTALQTKLNILHDIKNNIHGIETSIDDKSRLNSKGQKQLADGVSCIMGF